MSIMICNACKCVYGPTVFTCPKCGSGDVSVATVSVQGQSEDGTQGEQSNVSEASTRQSGL